MIKGKSSSKNGKKVRSIALVLLFVLLFASTFSIFSSTNTKSSNKESAKSNPLEGKYVSFLGDSITTYEDYNNNTSYNTTIGGNSVWYNSSKLTVEDTYWYMAMTELDMKLCVNNSWSGSEVTTGTGQASGTRCQNLHNNVDNVTPDIIVVYIGINDYLRNNTLGSFDGIDSIYNSSTGEYIGNMDEFSDAYATMVHKIKKAYPKADIYLCTLQQYDNTGVPAWNQVINSISRTFGCTVVDFYNKAGITVGNKTLYTFDGLHPNANGMKEMARVLTDRISKNYD